MALAVSNGAFRFPAEWEPHAACWVAWPHLAEEWADDLEPARREWVAMCTAIADPAGGRTRGDALRVIANDERSEREARAALGAIEATFHRAVFGDIWLRDIGPTFLTNGAQSRAACFRFNGWGGKYVFEGDADMPRAIADAARVEAVEHSFVLEGGAIDSNGEGTLLTTEQCVLNPNRNGPITRAAVESVFRETLGIERVVWIKDGLANDHTDGHVDTLARFVGPARVACMVADRGDPNFAALDENRRLLEAARTAKNEPIEVVTIPSPGIVENRAGKLMPASYANFYVSNSTVVVPTYGVPNDDAAVEGIARLFPTRRTIGSPAIAILTGGGAFHCVTQQEPLPSSGGGGRHA
jgi:agmatine deiminase